MSARIEYGKKEIKVYLDGEIDHHSACLIRVSIDEAIMRKRPSLLILDFGKVSFMDSSGVGLVMGRYRLATNKGKSVALKGLGERDHKIMKMSGIEKLMPISKREN